MISQSHHCALKALMWTFILGGVVLINAYKNSNVYKVMSHEEAIPYTRLDQFIADRFSIFTRISKVHMEFNQNWFH